MSITTTLHVNFRGNAREALEFYHSVFGGDLSLVPYSMLEASDGGPGQAEQIVWGQVEAPSGFRLMAYDVQDSLPFDAGQNPFYVSLRSTDEAEIRQFGDALAQSDGAIVHVPFGPSAFSPLYGKITDRFGVTWIIDLFVPWS